MKQRYKSFGFAWQGIKYCLFNGINFRIQLCCGLLACILGSLFCLSASEWAVILMCIVLVLSLEMINTAIEQLCNMVHPEIHPAIKIIKDVVAGAVLVCSVMTAVIGAIIFIPKILSIGYL